MPNRYEREIEEILRNLEQGEPRPGKGQRFGERQARKPGVRIPRQRQSFTAPQFSAAEWLLIITVIAALIAGGYAYTQGAPDVLSGVLGCIGIACLILVALSYFLFQSRHVQSARYGNVTITPIRRNPLSNLKTRWNLFLLRIRYRRNNRS